MVKQLCIVILTALCFGSIAGAGYSKMNAYQFHFKSIDGQDMALSDFKGKVVLVVNTASKCGFTPQYHDLQQLWSEYKDKGLVVLGVPSNDFGGQEPGSESQITEFVAQQFKVTFPMTQKVSVSGKNAHPFYVWAKEQKGIIASPKWNFHKYLIGPDGDLVEWYASTTSPVSKRVKDQIDVLLDQNIVTSGLAAI